jgi:muconolactone delta-isomerase
MKFLVTVTPGPMPPPLELVREAREWIDARLKEGTFEAVYAFPHGGGCSIGEYDSHEQLMEELMDYPLSPFVDYDVEPLVELDAAFERFIPFVERMSERMAGAAAE